jgi:hypothetical protein
MKAIKLIIILFSLAVVNSCENYNDNPIEYSPIFPVSGEWRIRVTNTTTSAVVGMYTFSTYNTSDNSSTEMWIRTTSNMGGGLGTLRGKITCDVPNLSFSATDVRDISHASATFSITDAKITPNEISMPSGVKADKISFRLTTSKVPGTTYLFEGYRRTLWPEDEAFTSF